MMTDRNNIRKIAVFRALQLGDMLCAVPALRSIRKSFPQARISLIGLRWSGQLVARYPELVDDHLWFPGYPGLPEQVPDLLALVSFLDAVRREQFDLVIQLHGSGTVVNPLVSSFKAKQIAGFHQEDHYKPSATFTTYPKQGHEIHRLLGLASFLGMEDAMNDELYFPLYDEDEEQLVQSGFALDAGSYICIHAGARDAARQWPARYFAMIADACVERGYDVVLTGTAEERTIISKVSSLMSSEPIDASGRTTLGSLGMLIQRSAAVISNCTGVAHMAAALKKRSLVIGLGDEPERWAPLDARLHTHLDCRISAHRHKVMDALGRMLGDINYGMTG